MDVLLLAQPAGQAVLVDAEEDRGSEGQGAEPPACCRRPNTPVQSRRSQALFDDVTGQQEGGTCGGTSHTQTCVFCLSLGRRGSSGDGDRWRGGRAAAPG